MLSYSYSIFSLLTDVLILCMNRKRKTGRNVGIWCSWIKWWYEQVLNRSEQCILWLLPFNMVPRHLREIWQKKLTERECNSAQGCLTAFHNWFCISCLMWQSSHSSISFVLLLYSLRCRLDALLRNNGLLDISLVLICMLLKVGVYTHIE